MVRDPILSSDRAMIRPGVVERAQESQKRLGQFVPLPLEILAQALADHGRDQRILGLPAPAAERIGMIFGNDVHGWRSDE